MAKEPLLRPEEVASVLDSGGATEGRERAGTEPAGEVVYSLRRPVAIAPDAEEAARARLAAVATVLEGTLRAALEAEVTIELRGFRQEQAHAAVETLPAPGWILSFLCDEGGLALAVDPACALSVVELALGGAGNTAAKGREPTPLESRVMTKLCSALAPPLAERTGIEVRDAVFRTGSLPPALAAPGQTMCVGLLGIDLAGHDRSGLLLATPRLLRPDTGDEDEHAAAIGPLAARLDRVRVEVRPVLPAGRVTLADLMQLEPGTVLRLDAAADSPIELRVAGRTALRGRISREGDQTLFQVDWRRGRDETALAKENKQ